MTRTEERLRKIAEREKQATPGEWYVYGGGVLLPSVDSENGFIVTATNAEPDERDAKNIDFIAHARQDIPWLLELIKRQQAVVDAAREIDVDDVPDYGASLTRLTFALQALDAFDGTREGAG